MSLQYDPEFAQVAEPLLEKYMRSDKPTLHDVESRRARLAALLPHDSPQIPEDVEQIVHYAKATDNHEVAIYHFRKKDKSNMQAGPAVVHMHGGGYIGLSAPVAAEGMAMTASYTGVQMFTIEYRLAPEYPYPVPLEDCWTALQWIHSQAETLSIDPSRIAVMGESAGGGLAAALTLLARDRKLSPPLAKQILIYPMLDDRTRSNHAGELAFWDVNDNITGWTAYVGSDLDTDKVTPYAAPARVASVEQLPALYLDCAQLDMFVHENLEYARRFLTANIPVEFHLYQGLPHAFEALAASSAATQRAAANRLRAMTSF